MIKNIKMTENKKIIVMIYRRTIQNLNYLILRSKDRSIGWTLPTIIQDPAIAITKTIKKDINKTIGQMPYYIKKHQIEEDSIIKLRHYSAQIKEKDIRLNEDYLEYKWTDNKKTIDHLTNTNQSIIFKTTSNELDIVFHYKEPIIPPKRKKFIKKRKPKNNSRSKMKLKQKYSTKKGNKKYSKKRG